MRVCLGLVSEDKKSFVNEVSLCLYSLRKNGGQLKNVPVVLITNGSSLSSETKQFFVKNFAPITFKVSPPLDGPKTSSKYNVFYSIEPDDYDVLLFMDCDTVVKEPLDAILDPIMKHGVQFLCRRAGKHDLKQFFSYAPLLRETCAGIKPNKVLYEGREEFPAFNSGVFLATSEAVRKIRAEAVKLTYKWHTRWHRCDSLEKSKFIGWLYNYNLRPSSKPVREAWSIEQIALGLACLKQGVRVQYLDEAYNSVGETEDFKILHCLKSVYPFDRETMLSEEASQWVEDYQSDPAPGRVFLANTIKQYWSEFGTN